MPAQEKTQKEKENQVPLQRQLQNQRGKEDNQGFRQCLRKNGSGGIQMNFTETAKAQYDELIKKEQAIKQQLQDLRRELSPLKAYLKELGILPKQKRAPRRQ